MLLDYIMLFPAVASAPVRLVITEVINVMVSQQTVDAVVLTNA